MASTTLYDRTGKSLGSVELADALFAAPVNAAVLHQVVTAQLAGRRTGTHDTKTRGEIRGGGKKPYRQKGTGRARQGSTVAPHYAGGGVVFGPHPRSYEQRFPKRMKRLALRGALTSKFDDGAIRVVEDLGLDELAAIFYTSGTTGFPKGAVTTHANFLSNCETCRRVLSLEKREPIRTLVSVPLFHVTGCNSQLLVAVYLGGTTVVMPQFEVNAFLDAITAERIDILTTVPAIYWLAINQPRFADVDVSGVRNLSYGGAPIAPDLVGRLVKAFPRARVGNGFGLTETSSVTSYLPHGYVDHADSVGFAAPVCDVRIDSPSADGVGELNVCGPNVVAGYWNKPAETVETFVDGWLHTGDLARIDEQGLIYIVDRLKDMINRGGENVYCVEVENALAGAPGVFEAAVVGVPDDMMGEKVGAVLVSAPGADLDVAAVLSYLDGRIARFKVPQFVSVRAEPLPRNPGGKILKRRVRDETDWGDPVR